MTRHLARPFATLGLLLAIAGAVGAIALRRLDPVPMIGSFGFGDPALIGLSVLGVAFALVGALLVERRPANAVGWCMVLIGAGYALGMLTAAITFSALADGPAGSDVARMAAWLTVVFTTIGGLVFGLGLIFPTGRGHTPGWDRVVQALAITLPVLCIVLFVIRPGPLHLFPNIVNPLGVGPDIRQILGDRTSEIIAASAGLVFPFLVLSMVSRYRMSDAVGRQQLKWFLLALVLALVGVAAASVGALISNEPPAAGLALFGFAGALIPVAIGIAILRYRLYDIDRLISRTLAYAAITGVLAVVFYGVILLVGALFTTVANDAVPTDRGGTIAVAVSTLVVFVLFQPVRRGVQRAVDRRFDRARYDADQMVAAFAGRLRNDVDLQAVSQEIVTTATNAVRPASATVWLREPGR
jgi:hypothetical protein